MSTIDNTQLFAELDALFGPALQTLESPPAQPSQQAPAPEPERPPEVQTAAVVFELAPVAIQEKPPEAPVEPKPRTTLKTILVVDDNQDYRDMVKYILEQNNYRVLEASNGAEGLALVGDCRPDLVVADFNMPQMNGFELIQGIRSRYETRNVPIIVMTGASNRQQLKELFGNDISRFLEKPMTNDDLLNAVWACLEAGPAPEAAAPGQPVRVSPVEKIYVAPPSAEEAPAAPAVSLELAPVEASAEPPARPPAPPPTVSLENFEEDKLDTKFMDMVQIEEAQEAAQEDVGLEGIANDSPLISMVNKILVQAVGMRASDVHIEPQERGISVRVRLDGNLQNLCMLPVHLAAKLSARIKIMSSLVITERRLPQDGMFKATIRGQKVEFRVSTLPCIHGEKIVLRILGGSKLKADLEAVGLAGRNRACVEKALASPHGLILVTGPTGSGKTTTLYSMINVLNKPDVNIMTAEDPVEYQLPGISQAQVKASIGMTFEAMLRSFLRQDPDIMLVGEIRDLETAEIAVKASVTGHLVLSTLHTNSAPGTITRLAHMGLPPYLVAASVKVVVAQRLIKLLCPSCKAPAPLSDEDKRFLTEAESASLASACRPAGCAQCRQTGYAGRKPIFEVMPVDSAAMRQLVFSSASSDDLALQAVKEGMISLRQAALAAVADGSTSIDEALGIVLSD